MFDLGYIERLSIEDVLTHRKVFELGEEAQECEEPIRSTFKEVSKLDETTIKVVKLLIPLAKAAPHLSEIIYKMEVFRINEKATKIIIEGCNPRNASWLTHDGFLEYYELWRPRERENWPEGIPANEDPSKLDYETVKKCYKAPIRYGVSADDIFNFLKAYIIIKTNEEHYESYDDEIEEDEMEMLIPEVIGHEALLLDNPDLIRILRKKNPIPKFFADFLIEESIAYEERERIIEKFFIK